MSFRSLPKALQEKAEKELNENPTRIQSDLNHLRDWMEKQHHLIARKDDQTLLSFLRSAKFSLERAKEKLDAYYTIRTSTKNFFSNRDPFLPVFQEMFNQGAYLKLSDSNPLSPVVIFIRWVNCDTEKWSIVNHLRMLFMSLDIIIKNDDKCFINGVYILQDMADFSFSYIKQLTPTLMKKGVMALQDAYPMRLKGVYIVNAPSFFESTFAAIKPLFKEKIRKRLHLYGKNYSSYLSKEVPLSVIPDIYGGTAGSIDKIAGEWKKTVESHADWLLDDSKYGTDESKRIGKSKIVEELFGLDGSFRSLTID